MGHWGYRLGLEPELCMLRCRVTAQGEAGGDSTRTLLWRTFHRSAEPG